jgi:hypothetical protein
VSSGFIATMWKDIPTCGGTELKVVIIFCGLFTDCELQRYNISSDGEVFKVTELGGIKY